MELLGGERKRKVNGGSKNLLSLSPPSMMWLSTDRKKPEDEEEKAPACAAQGDHNEEQDALSQLLQ